MLFSDLRECQITEKTNVSTQLQQSPSLPFHSPLTNTQKETYSCAPIFLQPTQVAWGLASGQGCFLQFFFYYSGKLNSQDQWVISPNVVLEIIQKYFIIIPHKITKLFTLTYLSSFTLQFLALEHGTPVVPSVLPLDIVMSLKYLFNIFILKNFNHIKNRTIMNPHISISSPQNSLDIFKIHLYQMN